VVQGYTPHSGRVREFDGRKRVIPREIPAIPAPPWPLGSQSPREADLWAELFRNPVSILWREEDLVSKAALYARKVAEAEKPGSPASLLGALRGLADDLYMSVAAQRRAGITLAIPNDDGSEPTAPASASAHRAPARSQRDGLSALRRLATCEARGFRQAAGSPLLVAAAAELAALGVTGMTPSEAVAAGLVA
jgi:hypothetical protein